MQKKLNDRLKEWKGKTEELWLQLNLGASEAKDQYEKQKKELAKWVEETKVKLNDLPDKSSAKAKELQVKLDELKKEAEKKTAETKEKLKEQQEILSEKLDEVKDDLKEAYAHSSDKAAEYKEKAEEKLTDFQTRFDVFKLQLHLGSKEAQELWERKKKETVANLKELDEKIDKAADVTGELLHNVGNELKSSWSKLKKTFK